jgi:hypothetical protein
MWDDAPSYCLALKHLCDWHGLAQYRLARVHALDCFMQLGGLNRHV